MTKDEAIEMIADAARRPILEAAKAAPAALLKGPIKGALEAIAWAQANRKEYGDAFTAGMLHGVLMGSEGHLPPVLQNAVKHIHELIDEEPIHPPRISLIASAVEQYRISG